ncbi:type IV pilin N-terminal domain-containing protein [Halomicroarcula sp. F13]|uniref:Type IV pilin N-terminal domain-containing protein n=1 Tax=Haloarcula rubra TaxID=2487747 RepID=A0AAW4PP51_9EURY|nr:type IV pilin N-terminal domain-containing protein [Halomicroarcula rubra]MBX0322960.1 type IV pilin N-terminal domain-containing protein [Halomicroarcula rubra]
MGVGSERGVSPVVGVVLMVAIVVVLAATVGAYLVVFTGEQPSQAPQTAIVADYSERTTGNGEYLNLSFESGDTLDRTKLSLAISGARDSTGTDATLTGDPLGTQAPTSITSGVEISIHAGHFSEVGPGEHLDLSEATLRLVWDPKPSTESETYVVYRWPDPSRR